ncbi:MAG: hypothetical protein MUF45_07315 [Spirosomaceae bacterium]|nr:hypothetical protein [Spirosomataceae bacterium]
MQIRIQYLSVTFLVLQWKSIHQSISNKLIGLLVGINKVYHYVYKMIDGTSTFSPKDENQTVIRYRY